MSEERKEEKLEKNRLLLRLDYWGSECRKCAEHHGYSCETGCPHQSECEEAHKQIRQLIQKKPEKYFVIIKIKEYGEVTSEIRYYDTKGEVEAWVNKVRIAAKSKTSGFEILETFFYEGREYER